jgi:thiol-disulfide isomerase/thioredoxin
MKLPKQVTKLLKKVEKQPGYVRFAIMALLAYGIYYLFKQLRWGVGNSHYLEGFNNKTFVFFRMDGCPHCENMRGEWSKFVNNHKGDVATKEVEASQDPAMCKKYGVKGFPSLLLINNGKVIKKFEGERKASAFESFVASN